MDPGEVDATRRTRLANERTYLAWWRGGLTGIAVALAVAAALPRLTGGERWPFLVLGTGFAVLGVLFIGYGVHRFQTVERALQEGRFAPLDIRAAVALAVLGVVLALLTIVTVLVEA